MHVALLPEVWERVLDGVEFRLTAALADGGEVATASFVSSPGRLPHHRKWTELNLSLARFAEHELVLTLRTNVPDGELAHFAWALWGDPAIECDDVVMHRLSSSGTTGVQASSAVRGNGAQPSTALPGPARLLDPSGEYQRWILLNEPDEAGIRRMAARQSTWPVRPKISVVVPVLDPKPDHLAQAVESVRDQLYDNWELCIADGGSDDPAVRQLLEKAASTDARVKVTFLGENRGIAANTNAAVALATGEFVALLDHDDRLARVALHEVVELINERPGLDFIYSDEDKIGAVTGEERHSPHFKPAWSPDTFLSHNCINHFTVIRKTLIDAVGGLRDGFEGSQDYDLYLRALARTDEIAHIPKVLYHWRAVPGSAAAERTAKPHAFRAAKRAIKAHLDERGIEAEVVDGKFIGSYRVRYPVPDSASVEIVIPTRDRLDLLRPCVESILEKTTHRRFTIRIVDHRSANPDTLDYLHRIGRHDQVVVAHCDDEEFNFAKMCNDAVKRSNAEFVGFLNNDTDVIEGEWLTSMLEFAQRPDVGAVGAKLLYPGDHIQHAGVIVGLGGVAGHAHLRRHDSDHGYFGRADLVQNLSAVTAACTVMRRSVFEEMDGFDENFRVAYNDVDLCLRMRQAGYLVVYTPYATLYHHESPSRGSDIVPEKLSRFDDETELLKRKWGSLMAAGDPYYSRNLSRDPARSFDLRLDAPAHYMDERSYIARGRSLDASAF